MSCVCGDLLPHTHTFLHIQYPRFIIIVPVATCLSEEKCLAGLFIPLLFISCCPGLQPGPAGWLTAWLIGISLLIKAREWNVASQEITINTGSHILILYRPQMGMRSTLSSPLCIEVGVCLRTYLHTGPPAVLNITTV